MSGSNSIQRLPPGPIREVVLQLQAQVAALQAEITTLRNHALLRTGNAISAQSQPIQHLRDPKFSTDAVNLRTLYRIVRAEVAAGVSAAVDAEGADDGTTGGGSAPPTVPLANLFSLVQSYANSHPDELANSCVDQGGNNDFMRGLVTFLQGTDVRVGANGKRGVTTDPSQDAVSYYHGVLPPVSGSNNVYVIDVIGCHCPDGVTCSAPYPVWNNVTRRGVAGAWLPAFP